MIPPAWCEQYVGKPFAEKGRGPDGFDCWGLVRTVLAEQFGIASLPDYTDAYTASTDSHSVAAAVEAGRPRFERVHMASPGAIVILRIHGRPWHCAIACGNGWMLHVVAGANVVLEKLDSWIWRNHIEGFYKCLS